MNLVAPCLRLGDLPDDDPALLALCHELERDGGIAEALTRKLVQGIAGVDYLGSLLKVDAAIREALNETTRQIERGKPGQGDLFQGFAMQQAELSFDAARETVLEKLKRFLEAHSTSEDLGLRLHGEQVASGVRFVGIVKEGSYDVVVGNPPYQGLSKTAQFEYVAKRYPKGKADLYAAFLERGWSWPVRADARGSSRFADGCSWDSSRIFAATSSRITGWCSETSVGAHSS